MDWVGVQITPPTPLRQPQIPSAHACPGVFTFEVGPAMGGNLDLPVTYIWQQSTDGGVTWIDAVPAPNNNHTSAHLTVIFTENNIQFRRIATRDGRTNVSNVATISKIIGC